MTHRPPKNLSIREKGLRTHLGELDWQKFRYHYDYQMKTFGKINYGQLAKATGWSRQTVWKYVEIFEAEVAQEADND